MALREAENDYYEFLLRKRALSQNFSDVNDKNWSSFFASASDSRRYCKEITRKFQNPKHTENLTEMLN